MAKHKAVAAAFDAMVSKHAKKSDHKRKARPIAPAVVTCTADSITPFLTVTTYSPGPADSSVVGAQKHE
jgi:hypothetical protein